MRAAPPHSLSDSLDIAELLLLGQFAGSLNPNVTLQYYFSPRLACVSTRTGMIPASTLLGFDKLCFMVMF